MAEKGVFLCVCFFSCFFFYIDIINAHVYMYQQIILIIIISALRFGYLFLLQAL